MLLGYLDYFYKVLIFFIFLFLYDRSLAVLIVKINIFNNRLFRFACFFNGSIGGYFQILPSIFYCLSGYEY